MPVVLKVGTSPKPIYPELDVSNCLRDELVRVAREDAALSGRVLPTDESALSHSSVELDSLRVVSTLCRLDELLGFEVKDSVVQYGGYGSIDSAMRQLLPRIKREWDRHHTSRGERS